LLNASTEHEFETVFITELHAGGLVITSDSFFFAHIDKLAALAAQNRVPAIFGFREFPAAGGLMSYGSDLARCACDAEQIFRFCRPAIAMILILGFSEMVTPGPGIGGKSRH
jgi:hypothetical protein